MAMTLPKLVGEQCRILYLSEDQNQVILGVAGSGKSVEATYRALWVSQAHPDDKVLLLTFNAEVNKQLQEMVDSYDHGDNIEVSTIYTYFSNLINDNYPKDGELHKTLRESLQSRGKKYYGKLVATTGREERNILQSLYKQSLEKYPNSTIWNKPNSYQFIRDEIEWLQRNAVTSLEQYLGMERIGRNDQRISQQQRETMYRIFEDCLQIRRDQTGKPFGYNDIYQVVAKYCDVPEDVRPKYVIVDEVQDLSPAMFEGLKAVLRNDCVWTVFGDLSQNIFGDRISWSAVGLDHVQKQYRMQKNYRNTKQIGLVAKAMLDTDLFPKDANYIEPSLTTLEGDQPLLWHLTKDNQDYLTRQVRAMAQTGSTAVILMNSQGKWPELGEAQSVESQMKALLTEIGVPVVGKITEMQPGTVYLGTINRIKGLEFDSVVVCCIDDLQRGLSAEARLANGELNPQLPEEDQFKLAKTIYVAATRARKHLTLAYRNNPLPFVIPNQNLFQVVK